MSKKINLYFTRDFSLAITEFWHILLVVNFKKDFGVGINQIMRFNGRALEAYRLRSEMDKVKSTILNLGIDHKIFSSQSVNQFKRNMDKAVKLLKKVETNKLAVLTENFEESIEIFKLTFPWISFSNFLPGFWGEDIKNKYPKNGETVLKRWYKARVFSEGKFEMLDVYWRKMIGQLLEAHKIDKKFSNLVRFKEAKELIINNNCLVNKEILIKRSHGYIFYKNKLAVEKNFSEFLRENNFVYDDLKINTKVNVLQGQIASLGGIIKGRVQIILNSDEAAGFKKGNILITTMTTPDFLPAMKKATVIITDEGGITCHAAIVSRELKIPCIIGTKIATKIFKDGDLVEVDANKGIVKIIK